MGFCVDFRTLYRFYYFLSRYFEDLRTIALLLIWTYLD